MTEQIAPGTWVKFRKTPSGVPHEGIFIRALDGLCNIWRGPNDDVFCLRDNITHIGPSMFDTCLDQQYKQLLGPNQRFWVDELKSGKYKQTTGRLCDRDQQRHYSYCCLGVGTKCCHSQIDGIDNIFAIWRKSPRSANRLDTAGMPENAMKHLGLRECLGCPDRTVGEQLYPGVEFAPLSYYNDVGCSDHKKTLKEIGEWLEKYPEVYFADVR